jgi:transcriptional regulator NrdR family protein
MQRTGERQPKVLCPHCGHWDSKVVGHGIPTHKGSYKRTRQCQACRKPYHTLESAISRLPTHTTAISGTS